MRQHIFDHQELFRLITENAGDMIAVVDVNGKRLYNSPSYERILGYTCEELNRTASLEQVHVDDRPKVIAAAQEARKDGIGRGIEYRMRHKDGSWRILESTASVVKNGSGAATKIVIVNRDITERRQLEEQFRQAQKMEAIGRLSGGVAHDFNNLLGVIIGYAEMLQEKFDANHSARASVDEIVKAGKHAASLTRQLLAFSRQQVLELEVLDPNDIVADIEKMLRRLIGEDIKLMTSLDRGLGRVRADRGQLEQVFLNLAVNSRDAMPTGGNLLIETCRFEMDQEYVLRFPYPVKPGPYARLTMTDTGVGMDLATQARIFEPFFTTKEKGRGTGLGLSTVYGVVKQSGGYIEVRSEPGEGASFIIYFPIVQEVPTETKLAVSQGRSTGGNETILLVEDEESLRTLTRNLLELSGYTVLEAQTGYQALEIATNHLETIRLLLTDVVMPGINGRDLAKRLLCEKPKLKIIYMSGYTGSAVGDNNILGKDAIFLQKPFSRENLSQKVREALESL
ncbi:MAG: PAS domain S-box protein [Candidatus Acidiferrum sp.]